MQAEPNTSMIETVPSSRPDTMWTDLGVPVSLERKWQ